MAIIKRPPQMNLSDINVSNADIATYNTPEAVYARAASLGIRTFPFDIITYLKRHGIKVEYEEMDDMSGFVQLRNGQFVVGINKYQNETRQRFTATHELAHIINDRQDIENGAFANGESLLFRDNDTRDARERRADDLASNILMPKEIFDNLLRDGIRNIEEIADRFNVSPAAVKYRAYKLGYIQGY